MELHHPTHPRTIAARRPPGFEPAARRLALRWRKPVSHLVADWFGVQGADSDTTAGRSFIQRLTTAAFDAAGPDCYEVMACPSDETGRPATVVVAYWTSAVQHATWSAQSNFGTWWESPDRLGDEVGYWRETVVCPYDRHETIHSNKQYSPGLGRTAESEMVEITDNGYFGAARDRIPASAVDALGSPVTSAAFGEPVDPRGRRIVVHVPLNTTVIRSGQYWQDSEPAQAVDYETSLRPKLDRGMEYLAGDPASGCHYLRRLTNLDDQGRRRRETSVYAVFRDLADLERWARDHSTHHAIYQYAIAKSQEYGTRRDVLTWHEAFVLPAGNRFEYINCAPGTGMTCLASPLGSE